MFYKKDMQKLTGLVYNKHGDVGIFNQVIKGRTAQRMV